MNILLFDDANVRVNLYPLAFTRPVAEFRVGITTIREKWEKVVPGQYSYLTADYLSEKFPAHIEDDNLFIAGNVVPLYSEQFASAINSLLPGQAMKKGDLLVAFRGSVDAFNEGRIESCIAVDEDLVVINRPYDIFLNNGRQIVADYSVMDISDNQPISDSNRVIGPMTDSEGRPLIYIAPGATVEGTFLNTTHGPIVICQNAEVMEGSCLRGPVTLCEHGVINLSTRVWPNTTIGPWCKVGGELNNVVFFGFSNKAHDGFLGNAVVGEWCNLGADTVASNLKNDYTKIRIWNYATERFERTDLQFCGLIIGDHSKAGINTMFNTATVVGVGCNVFGSGFPRNFISSFNMGGASGFERVPLKKLFDMANRMMARRHKELSPADISILTYLYNLEK